MKLQLKTSFWETPIHTEKHEKMVRIIYAYTWILVCIAVSSLIRQNPPELILSILGISFSLITIGSYYKYKNTQK